MCVLTNPCDPAALHRSTFTPRRHHLLPVIAAIHRLTIPHLTHLLVLSPCQALCSSSVPKNIGSPTTLAYQQRTDALLSRSFVINNPTFLYPFPFLLD